LHQASYFIIVSGKTGDEHINDLKKTGLKNTGSHIHLLGIGGSAMAPLAGMLKERGYYVTGSDKSVYPPASTLLQSLAIPWKEGFSPENLKPAPDIAVIGMRYRAAIRSLNTFSTKRFRIARWRRFWKTFLSPRIHPS
jgi:UDP-N-acetylmuramate-alanine ligase